MQIHDPIYGRFEVGDRWLPLLLAPEVRRLSQVRLLNASTPSLATLGEIRRYSHTLGVLHLCDLGSHANFTKAERDALYATILLHDIGTPPFGHLLEYHLRERSGWDHESNIRAMIHGHASPENRAQQIFAGQGLAVIRALRRCNVSLEIVEEMLGSRHPMARLLFGTLDLDNLDNVVRMGWALGMLRDVELPHRIAAGLGVTKDGQLQLRRDEYSPDVKAWMELRRAVYEVLVFDPPTVAAQAILSDAIAHGFEAQVLDPESDWALYDEELVERLRHFKNTRRVISREYLGHLPQMVCYAHMDGTLEALGFGDRAELRHTIEELLSDILQDERVLCYIFVDKGAFEKKLEFHDPGTGDSWSIGTQSATVVLHVFSRLTGSRFAAKARAAEVAVRQFLSERGACVLRSGIRESGGGDDHPSFAF